MTFGAAIAQRALVNRLPRGQKAPPPNRLQVKGLLLLLLLLLLAERRLIFPENNSPSNPRLLNEPCRRNKSLARSLARESTW